MANWSALIPDAPFDWALIPLDGRKRPIDPATGKVMEQWQNQPGYDVDGLSALNGHVLAAGLILGPASGGVLAVDFDGPDAPGKFQEIFNRPATDLPPTVGVTSGKHCRGQRLFQVDQDWWPHLRGRREWKHNGSTCLELRWAGHQSVIAGAHPETNGYSWLPDSSPADRELALAPDWLLEPLLRSEAHAEPFQPTTDDAKRAVAMLQCISTADRTDYDSWLDVGMALHHTDLGLLAEWVDWSKAMPNFDEAECLAKWESFGTSNGSRLTIRSLHHWAKPGGYKEPKRKAPDKPVAEPAAQPSGAAQGDQDDEAPDVAIERLVNELLDLRLTTKDTWSKEMAVISSVTRTYGVQRQDVERRILEALAERWRLSITQAHTGTRTNRNSQASEDAEEQQMLVHGFLPWKRDALVFGPGGVGKTTASVALAWSVISGTPFLDHQIEGDITGKVLWIGSDGGDGAYDMWRNTAQDLGIADDPRWINGCVFWGSEAANNVGSWACTPAGLLELKTELETGGYALVIIDSWKAVLELAGIDFGIGPVGTVVRFLQALIGQHCSALYLHHPSGNSKGKGIAGAGGNQNVNQIPYAVHQLSPEPASENQPPCVRWSVHKLRGYQSREFLYRLTDEGLQVVQGDVITNCADAILLTIAELEALGTATSSHRIKNRLSTTNEKTISNNLTRLRQRGLLKKSGSTWHLTRRGKLAHTYLLTT